MNMLQSFLSLVANLIRLRQKVHGQTSQYEYLERLTDVRSDESKELHIAIAEMAKATIAPYVRRD